MNKNVAVVGATGAVGMEILDVLYRRHFPVGDLKLLASRNSAGKVLKFGTEDVVVEELTAQSFSGVDIAPWRAL